MNDFAGAWPDEAILHPRHLITERGKGFAFVGSQYPLEVGGQDCHLDLLFYHLRLRCFVVIGLREELPTTEDLAREFPLISLIQLRMAIERCLRALAPPAEEPRAGDRIASLRSLVEKSFATTPSAPISGKGFSLRRAL